MILLLLFFMLLLLRPNDCFRGDLTSPDLCYFCFISLSASLSEEMAFSPILSSDSLCFFFSLLRLNRMLPASLQSAGMSLFFFFKESILYVLKMFFPHKNGLNEQVVGTFPPNISNHKLAIFALLSSH